MGDPSSQSDNTREACVCYTIPVSGSPKLYLTLVFFLYLSFDLAFHRTHLKQCYGWFLSSIDFTIPKSFFPVNLCRQRVDNCSDLNDFEISNRYNIDNTGLVCKFSISLYLLLVSDVAALLCSVYFGLCAADVITNQTINGFISS